MKPSPLRATVRLLLFLAMNAAYMPAYALCLGPLQRWKRPIQVSWSRISCRLAGLEVRTLGAPPAGRSALFVANHVSYLDIPVFSAVIDATFVAKSEVGGWPLFGWIAKLTRAILVKRDGRDVGAQRGEMQARLLAGENLILFPEGTSTDGSGVAPFKSSLFGIVQGLPPEADLMVQPVSVAYPRYADGTRLEGRSRALYCWFGDATLLPHLFRVFGLDGAEVEVRFHEPIPLGPSPDRKDLSRRAQAAVEAGVAASNAMATDPAVRLAGSM
jgi:1-acyl-sn-glycerol-3-phosphate acyltransferase